MTETITRSGIVDALFPNDDATRALNLRRLETLDEALLFPRLNQRAPGIAAEHSIETAAIIALVLLQHQAAARRSDAKHFFTLLLRHNTYSLILEARAQEISGVSLLLVYGWETQNPSRFRIGLTNLDAVKPGDFFAGAVSQITLIDLKAALGEIWRLIPTGTINHKDPRAEHLEAKGWIQDEAGAWWPAAWPDVGYNLDAAVALQEWIEEQQDEEASQCADIR